MTKAPQTITHTQVARELARRKGAGEIERFDADMPVPLDLPDGKTATLVPDFAVMRSDGVQEFHLVGIRRMGHAALLRGTHPSAVVALHDEGKE